MPVSGTALKTSDENNMLLFSSLFSVSVSLSNAIKLTGYVLPCSRVSSHVNIIPIPAHQPIRAYSTSRNMLTLA